MLVVLETWYLNMCSKCSTPRGYDKISMRIFLQTSLAQPWQTIPSRWKVKANHGSNYYEMVKKGPGVITATLLEGSNIGDEF